MQPELIAPEFVQNNSAEEIQERMMRELPEDIDDMPGGFPFDFTMPSALEKSELINYHLVRGLMIAFPEYSWDEWLELHGKQAHVTRHPAQKASGKIKINGVPGTSIATGTVFCTPATDSGPSIEFILDEECLIGEGGTVTGKITAATAGIESNVSANTVTLMLKPDKNITGVTNPENITGGTERETDGDYYDRIHEEYENSMTYLGNDADYRRWAKEAGAGDCIVIGAANGPGTVKLVLVDANGQPANEKLVKDVYNYIVSEDDRSKRLLPTGSAQLSCVPAMTVKISYTCTGIQHDETTNLDTIKREFEELVKKVYETAKEEGIVRYNDVRPIISSIVGVDDFTTFLMNGEMKNIVLAKEEYPSTGKLDFT